MSTRITRFLNRAIFGTLLGLIVITAIPYGTFEPWWKAAFVCAVFGICIVAIVESLVSNSYNFGQTSVLMPMLGLAALAFAQSLSQAISADPYQTRFFVLQMLALTACLALLYRYASNERRVRILVNVVIAVAVASALFGILRQTTQQQPGFVLPLLKQNHGYGQFLNKNHFAYLMEMAFGLGLGIILARGVKRDRVMIYVALLLPIWTALVLSNSRGGVFAMLIQVVVAALLLVNWRSSEVSRRTRLVVLRTVLLVVLTSGVLFGTLWVGGDRLATNIEAASSDFIGDASSPRDGASRNEIWRATLKMFAAHPILGTGFGGYWIGITAYHDASGVLTPQEAHNDYLELLSSGGLIGLAIGVWFATSLIRTVRKNLLIDRGYIRAVRFGSVLGITGVAAHSLVDFGLHMTSNALVFVVLIMMATTKIDEKVIDRDRQRQ
jgi:O-antigen ligase